MPPPPPMRAQTTPLLPSSAKLGCVSVTVVDVVAGGGRAAGSEALDVLSFHSPNSHGMSRSISAVFPRAERDILKEPSADDAGDIAPVSCPGTCSVGR